MYKIETCKVSSEGSLLRACAAASAALALVRTPRGAAPELCARGLLLRVVSPAARVELTSLTWWEPQSSFGESGVGDLWGPGAQSQLLCSEGCFGPGGRLQSRAGVCKQVGVLMGAESLASRGLASFQFLGKPRPCGPDRCGEDGEIGAPRMEK